jgi:glucose/arabinose dehydrogenase
MNLPRVILPLLLLALTGCDALGDDDDSAVEDPCAGVEAISGTTLQLAEFVTGLDKPVHLANAGDGTGRVFVVEQRGRIQSISRNGTVQPYLDLEDRVGYLPNGERGLLSVAFHPNFASNGRLFVDYTGLAPDGNTFVSEFVVTGDPLSDPPDKAGEIVLLEIPQPASNDNGGQLAFGPDGMLYIGTGDGGSSALGDPYGNGQNPGSLLAKVLRIDVDHEHPYTVPEDNPFVGEAGFRPEIYAWGVRNPWRFSFDRLTGDLWLADVGQDDLEEVDVVLPGDNCGWPAVEGHQCYEAGCDPSAFDAPVWVEPRPPSVAIVGGHVYRGCRMPDLRGVYLYSDYNYFNSPLKSLRWDGAEATAGPVDIEDTGTIIASFGEDEAGELYALDHDSGRVLKLVPGSE